MKNRDEVKYQRAVANRLKIEELKEQVPALFDMVTYTLFHHDPMGINFGDNTDEYDPEAATIIPRLIDCTDAEGVQRVIYEEFCHWFYDWLLEGVESFEAVAKDVWKIYRSHAGDELNRTIRLQRG